MTKGRKTTVVSVRLQDTTIAHIKATKKMGVSSWLARLAEREAWRSHSKKCKVITYSTEEYSEGDFVSHPDL